MSDDEYDMYEKQQNGGDNSENKNRSPIQYEIDEVIDNGIFR